MPSPASPRPSAIARAVASRPFPSSCPNRKPSPTKATIPPRCGRLRSGSKDSWAGAAIDVISGSILQRHDGFYLDGDIARKRAETDRRAGMLSHCCAEDLNEQVRAAVDNARMLTEFRRGIDHSQKLHDP